MTRRRTPPRYDAETKTTSITVQRACNGCRRDLGDVTDAEIEAAITGRPLPDVRLECGCLQVGPAVRRLLDLLAYRRGDGQCWLVSRGRLHVLYVPTMMASRRPEPAGAGVFATATVDAAAGHGLIRLGAPTADLPLPLARAVVVFEDEQDHGRPARPIYLPEALP